MCAQLTRRAVLVWTGTVCATLAFRPSLMARGGATAGAGFAASLFGRRLDRVQSLCSALTRIGQDVGGRLRGEALSRLEASTRAYRELAGMLGSSDADVLSVPVPPKPHDLARQLLAAEHDLIGALRALAPDHARARLIEESQQRQNFYRGVVAQFFG